MTVAFRSQSPLTAQGAPLLSARKQLDIVTAYRQVGTYRGAAEMCGVHTLTRPSRGSSRTSNQTDSALRQRHRRRPRLFEVDKSVDRSTAAFGRQLRLVDSCSDVRSHVLVVEEAVDVSCEPEVSPWTSLPGTSSSRRRVGAAPNCPAAPGPRAAASSAPMARCTTSARSARLRTGLGGSCVDRDQGSSRRDVATAPAATASAAQATYTAAATGTASSDAACPLRPTVPPLNVTPIEVTPYLP